MSWYVTLAWRPRISLFHSVSILLKLQVFLPDTAYRYEIKSINYYGDDYII